MISEVEWDNVSLMLERMTNAYTGDNLRKLAFNYEIFPLVLRFENGDRSLSLFHGIHEANRLLMKDFRNDSTPNVCGGFFMNPDIKPIFSDVLAILGREQNKWQDLFSLLNVELKVKVRLRYYNSLNTWAFEFLHLSSIRVVLIPDKDNFLMKIPSIREELFPSGDFADIFQIYPMINKYVKALPKNFSLVGNS